jgi:hypothetical protein
MGKSGAPGTTVLDGAPVAGIRENGLSWTLSGTAVASAASIVPTGNLFHVTGKAGITSVSAIGIDAGTEITLIFDDVLTVTSGANLKLSGNFTTATSDTLTLKWDGRSWYEQGRSTGASACGTVAAGTTTNTDSFGELTASSNTVTYIFNRTYISHPICIASNETTAGRDIRVTYNGTTSVTFTTPGPSDLLSYVCFNHN